MSFIYIFVTSVYLLMALVLGNFYRYLHCWLFFSNAKLDTDLYSFLYKNANCKWSQSKHSHPKLTLLFLLVQVTAFSLSDILHLWPFLLVWSPAPHLSTMMPTSLSVSVRLVPSTFPPVILTKFLNWLQLACLRMTKRLLQLVHPI